MAQAADELAADLISAGLSLTAGTNIFVGSLPDTSVRTVALLPYPGTGAEMKFGSQATWFENSRVQVQVRGADVDGYAGAVSLLESIESRLTGVAKTVGAGFYHRIRPLGVISLLRWDEDRRPIVYLDFEVVRQR